MDRDIHLVNVFTAEGRGGNLAPIVLDATGLADSEMKDVARHYERESAFVFPAPEGSGADFKLRFFVPEHEMDMCGHATVGTAWIMHRLGVVGVGVAKPERETKTETVSEIKFITKSGLVSTRHDSDSGSGSGSVEDDTRRDVENGTRGDVVSVSQPKGTVERIQDKALIAQILSVLRIDSSQLGPWPIQNACTSRVKTVIPLKGVETLNTLQPDFSKVRDLCDRLGSTGLYPYAVVQHGDDAVTRYHVSSHQTAKVKVEVEVEARQFPRASGYPEDAATGIAAAALSRALVVNELIRPGEKVVVYQGRAMGHLSQINVQVQDDGCWVGGTCALLASG